MSAEKSKSIGSSRPARGLPLWLLLIVTGLLAIGPRQMFRLDPREAGITNRQQITNATAASGWVDSGFKPFYPVVFHDNTSALNYVADPPLDPLAKLMQALQVENDSSEHEELIEQFLSTLKTEDMPKALDILQNAQPADLAEDLAQRLVRKWTEINPQDVAAWLANLPAGGERQTAMDNLAIIWANNNLTNATCWAQSLPDVIERDAVVITVANEAARTDPVTALRMAIGLQASAGRNDLICRAAMEWAAADPQSALAWAKEIPDPNLRSRVVAGEAIAFAKQYPVAAAALAANELSPGQLQNNTVVSIVERWAQQQPEAAAAWVADFPKGMTRTAAIENLVSSWSQSNPTAAQTWLAAHAW